MKKFTRGFTLIELLVVIAIIGILSSVVLVSLGTARNKGNDAKTEAQLQNMRAAAEIYYSANSNYGAIAVLNQATCTGGMFSDPSSGMVNLTAASSYWNATAPLCTTNNNPATAWLAYHGLTTAGTYWCVDSTGQSKAEAAAPGSGVVVCP